MNLQEYHERRQLLLSQEKTYRELCTTCLQPSFGCYCSHVQQFDPAISFVILIHPIEVKRRIATGRMSHLCLKNSHLIMGQDYSGSVQVQNLIDDPQFHSVILYPGVKSQNLTEMSSAQRDALVPVGKKLRIFVVDGTWATAKKMVRQSKNLVSLPRICFSPSSPSNFRVRKQPQAHCYSTIEAIHHTIELVGHSQGFATASREHDKLLYVFDKMVERQLDFIRKAEEKPDHLRYRRDRKRSA
ncbi:MAG: DTW domain-containing protein [Bdellovibrio sp.]|nr:DTW domain-containing protein [Bdellovibrio sp.]